MNSNETVASLNELLGNNEDYSCNSFGSLLGNALSSKELPEETKRVFTLIKHICSMFMHFNDTDNYTLRPLFEIPSRTSFTPQHLSEEDEDVLFRILGHIKLSSLKARVSDVIWLHKGRNKYQAALIAIPEYLKAIEILGMDNHDLCPSIARALTISAELGTSSHSLMEDAVAKCTNFILSVPANNATGMHSRLLKVLSRFDISNKDVSRKCEEFSEFALSHAHMLLYRSLLQTQLHFFQKDQDAQNKIKSKICESFVVEADSATAAISKSFSLRQAIEAYTRNGMKTEAQALYQRLEEAQKECLDEMHIFQTEPVDVSDLIQDAESHVANQSLMDALLRLAFIAPVIDIKAMIPEAAKEVVERPFLQIVIPTYVDDSGRPPFKVKGITSWTEDKATNFQLIENISFKIDWFVKTTLLPAIRKVAAEHDLSAGVFYALLTHHPLIPEGFEGYYARGIAAGFKQDFSAANLFLVPQFENSLRYVIGKHGGTTFIVDPEKGQRARNIDSVINDEILARVFDDAHLMILKHLLIDPQFGGMRHSLAHGLLPYHALWSSDSIYLWWVIFRVLFFQYVPKIR